MDAKAHDKIAEKMVKADLNGAYISVKKSPNEQLLSLEGIICKETARSFVIIARDNKQKILLKQGNIFTIRLPYREGKMCLTVDLWGDMLLYKGSERTKIKFKEKQGNGDWPHYKQVKSRMLQFETI